MVSRFTSCLPHLWLQLAIYDNLRSISRSPCTSVASSKITRIMTTWPRSSTPKARQLEEMQLSETIWYDFNEKIHILIYIYTYIYIYIHTYCMRWDRMGLIWENVKTPIQWVSLNPIEWELVLWFNRLGNPNNELLLLVDWNLKVYTVIWIDT